MTQTKRTCWFIAGLFTIIFILEYSTPPEYVFGYLYIGPILLASSRLETSATFWTTLVAVVLTLLNLWVPYDQLVNAPTIADRLIAMMALVVTGILSDRIRRSEEAIACQQAQLQAQQQLTQIREDFVSTLTHDLKTPLLGAIETIKAFQREQFGATTAEQQKVLDMMKRSHTMSLQMVETLLDVYRNDAEGLTLNLQRVDLMVIADESITTLQEIASSRQIRLVLSQGNPTAGGMFRVEGDAIQLQRVFANLITNSINHAPRGSRVDIILESQPGYHLVSVVDEGPGITNDELPYLFERFYQGHGDRQAKGSGLGLYLTRQIIGAHKGSIWAENRSPHGALFRFRLPASL